ncbi:DNA mismatch repair protein MutS [Fictibacillus phosphorivorans]|uniref:DNA mismatch repair protein MutS n=1 Tax=Fictibacillus phosphorivorans TaxID=1221500 RepID=UPI00203F8283|nr:DNA mismatch repair protein MutS [Fictibacillus phosphorivorans]MCM3717077.1 DNA mismatch repair protein MutS [Fictibacillus phosphorivorans]MCM3774764.1 DNA mismatch repair protein MutS [Fictibacillus phosphorivorans]
MAQYTPMIQQYLSIKAAHQDAFLFFRLGDFYEMFFEDAVRASQILEITLTSRDGGSQDRIPMCGVPYHSSAGYIKTLVENGYKVAICEQVEDPKQAVGVVKREVIQIITPGTVIDDHLLQDRENNYLVSIERENDSFAYIRCDLSTGELKGYTYSGKQQAFIQLLLSQGVKEIVGDAELHAEWNEKVSLNGQASVSIQNEDSIEERFLHLTKAISHPSLLKAAGRLFHYLNYTQKRSFEHLMPVEFQQNNLRMKLDAFSKRNLELTESIRGKGKKGSLLWLLDSTMTAMGARKLKQWIEEPLFVKKTIEKRLQLVEALINEFFIREEMKEQLKSVYDMERLIAKISYGNASPRDLVQLKRSLLSVPVLKEKISQIPGEYASEIYEKMKDHRELAQYLDSAIHDDAPVQIKEGGIIKNGYNEQLDEYKDASMNGKAWIAALEQQEKVATGIKSLKIGFNKIFGYYIEVTKSNLSMVPTERYERKQTLANAERYVTPELKEKERIILEAEEKISGLEYTLFLEVREHVTQYIPGLQQLAAAISELDVIQSFAAISEQYRYVKPSVSEDGRVNILGGRHPVVEKVMDAQEYVPNDIFLNDERNMLLITGPNMAGKSTYMRQLALTAIMMQIGCFVPAEQAEIPMFDQIFTRIGAADDLVGGQSTFMVEMLETNFALTSATKNSLILLDEIGRGTSTYDGMALAQSIIEFIHERIQAKTLFSTHYHELTVLENSLPSLKNVFVSAVEENGSLVFLHKVIDGQADKSFGIQVAELADLPQDVIQRAKTILKTYEKQEKNEALPVQEVSATKEEVQESQLSLFAENHTVSQKRDSKETDVLKDLKALNVIEMTPLEAMNALYKLQTKLK